MRKLPPFCLLLLLLGVTRGASAQEPWTWEKVRARFQQNNPVLQAETASVEESKADEITAYLRPNPTLTISTDGTQIAPHEGTWRPLTGTSESPGISYLHERRHKRELRLESAKESTQIAESSRAD